MFVFTVNEVKRNEQTYTFRGSSMNCFVFARIIYYYYYYYVFLCTQQTVKDRNMKFRPNVFYTHRFIGSWSRHPTYLSFLSAWKSFLQYWIFLITYFYRIVLGFFARSPPNLASMKSGAIFKNMLNFEFNLAVRHWMNG